MGVIVVNPYSTTSFTNSHSVDLGGTDEWILKSYEATLQPTELTYMCWIKTTFAGVYGGIMSQYQWNGGIFYSGCEIGTGGGILYLGGGNGGAQTLASSATTLNDGNWHHIAGTFNATQFRGYIDGVLVATTNAGQYAPGISQFAIGRQSNTGAAYPLTAKIANPAIIGRVLTLAEVQAAYALKMGNLKNLFGTDVKFAGYFPTGTSDYPTLEDYSGNGFDMTMTNMESGDITTDVPV